MRFLPRIILLLLACSAGCSLLEGLRDGRDSKPPKLAPGTPLSDYVQTLEPQARVAGVHQPHSLHRVFMHIDHPLFGRYYIQSALIVDMIDPVVLETAGNLRVRRDVIVQPVDWSKTFLSIGWKENKPYEGLKPDEEALKKAYPLPARDNYYYYLVMEQVRQTGDVMVESSVEDQVRYSIYELMNAITDRLHSENDPWLNNYQVVSLKRMEKDGIISEIFISLNAMMAPAQQAHKDSNLNTTISRLLKIIIQPGDEIELLTFAQFRERLSNRFGSPLNYRKKM